MIPLWKGKNPIYFGIITIIPFDNLYRQAYFVMHTFLVYNLQSRAQTHAILVIGLYELLCNSLSHPGPENLIKYHTLKSSKYTNVYIIGKCGGYIAITLSVRPFTLS
jgi:hypothetical protein